MKHDWAEMDFVGSGSYDCTVCDMNISRYDFEDDVEFHHYMHTSKCRGPIQPTNDLKATRFGWLSPEGKLYAGSYYGHLHLANKLAPGYRPDDVLLKKGWIRLSDTYSNNEMENTWFWSVRKPTKAQMELIFDWCIAHERPAPDFEKYKDLNEY